MSDKDEHMGKPDLTKVVDIKQAVEEKKRQLDKEFGKTSGGSGGTGTGLPDNFVQECLYKNELGDGLLFASLHRGQFVFNKSMDKWMVWEGHHWSVDKMDLSAAAVESVVDTYLDEAARLFGVMRPMHGDGAKENEIKRLQQVQKKIYDRVSRLRTTRGRAACMDWAHKCEGALSVEGNEIDQMPWLLPCRNGVLDLKTGELKDGRAEDYLMKACPIDWPAEGIDTACPVFLKALHEIFSDRVDLVDFFQRVMGMSLVGEVMQSVIVVLTGQGRNGKSLLVKIFSEILGPMAGPVRSEMLLDQGRVVSSSAPTPDIMGLRGRRFCFASETDDGCKISPSRVKWLTGNDRLTGRNPHDRFEVDFEPTHTLFLLTNHKPHAPADDFAFWERVILIPFDISFVDREPREGTNERRADPELLKRIREELPGILAWMVAGCLLWQAVGGLAPPPIVKEAVADYRRDEDLFADFIDECLLVGEDFTATAAELYTVFETWWTENVSKKVPSKKRFGSIFGKRFSKYKKGVYYYEGVGILNTDPGYGF